MPDPRQFHRSTTRVLSLAMIVIGVALLVRTMTLGGGATGILLGVLFIAAGGARIYLQTRQEDDS
jgi:hypothetical protein